MRTIEEAKADATEYVLSQIYSQQQAFFYSNPLLELNEYYLDNTQNQSKNSIVSPSTTLIPGNQYLYHNELQQPLSLNNLSTPIINANYTQACRVNNQNTDSNKIHPAISNPSQILVTQPTSNTQYIVDSNGKISN